MFPEKNTSIKDIYSVSIYAVSSGYVLSKGICPEEFSADCVQNEMSIPTGLQGMCRVNDAYQYCKPCVLRTDVNLGSFPGNGVRTAHLCVLNLCSVVLLARVSFCWYAVLHVYCQRKSSFLKVEIVDQSRHRSILYELDKLWSSRSAPTNKREKANLRNLGHILSTLRKDGCSDL